MGNIFNPPESTGNSVENLRPTSQFSDNGRRTIHNRIISEDEGTSADEDPITTNMLSGTSVEGKNSDLENKLQASENKINNLEGELEAIKKENSELKNKLKTSEKYVENLNLKNENLEEQYRTITVQNLNDKDYCIYENKKDHDVTIILRNFLSIADKIFKTDLWKSNSNNKRTDLYHFANNEFVDLKDRRLILKPNEKVGIIAWGGGNTFTEINLIFSVIN